jgi:glycosyltransferase involved in cell wall biosynthesis
VICVGFTLIGRGNWSGGETYLRNMLGVVAKQLAGQVSATLFLTPVQAQRIGTSFDALLSRPAIVDPAVEGAGLGSRALKALLTGSDSRFAALVAEQRIDVMFETAQWFGNGFPVPVLSWIPDFQHRRLPHLFGQVDWWRRELGFRVQTSGRRVVMLSSGDALSDCENFYPASRGKTTTVRFAIDLEPAAPHARAAEIRRAYDLPERFLYLPNQFWAHKNHLLVIKAMGAIAARGNMGNALPVIMTGRTEDPRDPGLFARCMAEVEAQGFGRLVRHLGLVPLSDVFALNAAADALINPSLFEGWSTTVEEAKALGTPMLLSDIPLHREQAANARFFDPSDANDLATLMLDQAASPGRPVPDLAALEDAQQHRRAGYAAALHAALRQAMTLR